MYGRLGTCAQTSTTIYSNNCLANYAESLHVLTEDLCTLYSSPPAVQPTPTSQTLLPSLIPTISVPVVVEPVRSILASNLSSVFVGKIIGEVGLCVCVCVCVTVYTNTPPQWI